MAENRRKGAGRPKGRQVVNVKWVDGKISRLPKPPTFNEILSDKHLMATRLAPVLDLVGHEEVEVRELPNCNLSDNQLLTLLAVLNKNCLVEALSVNELKEVFDGKRIAKVKNIGVLAYILKKLAIRGLICADWQHQAESLKMCVSVRNTPIKANKMASYLSTFEEQIKAYNGVIYKDNIPPTYKAKKELKQEIDNIVDSL